MGKLTTYVRRGMILQVVVGKAKTPDSHLLLIFSCQDATAVTTTGFLFRSRTSSDETKQTTSCKSPKDRVVPLPNGIFKDYKWGFTNHLPSLSLNDDTGDVFK